jgi:integrase
MAKTHFFDGKVVLYKRKEGDVVWQVRIKMGKGVGSWKRYTTGESDVVKAGEWACERYSELKMMEKFGVNPSPKSFKHVAELAIKEMELELEAGNGKVIYEDYIRALKKYLIPFFYGKKSLSIDSIGHRELLEYDAFRIEKLGYLPSKSLIAAHNAALRRAFDIAVRQKWMKKEEVPVLTNKGKEIPKQAPRPYFQKHELKKLFAFLKQQIWTGRTEKIKQIRTVLYHYARLVFYTGIRPGTECDGIRFCDIATFEGQDGKSFLEIHVDGKTGERAVSADAVVKSIIDEIVKYHHAFSDIDHDKEEFGVSYQNETARIFEIEATKDVPLKLSKHFKRALKESNLLYDQRGNERTLYSLRHTFATMIILDKGTNIHLVARHMGTSTEMIDNFYSHVKSKNKAEKLVLTTGFDETPVDSKQVLKNVKRQEKQW